MQYQWLLSFVMLLGFQSGKQKIKQDSCYFVFWDNLHLRNFGRVYTTMKTLTMWEGGSRWGVGIHAMFTFYWVAETSKR
jgi:hypothetical protein